MKDIELYSRLLDLPEGWEVSDVQLNLDEEEVNVIINYVSSKAPCPVCGRMSPIYDHRERRRWRHLDTCQLKTYLICEVPRIRCQEHGIVTVRVPWAGSHSRFSRHFERIAIDLLLAFKKQTKVAKILRISFDQLHGIMERAVHRGLKRRDSSQPIPYIGIDEKSIGAHHHYASVLLDLEKQRVLEVEENRDEGAATRLLHKGLDKGQRGRVKAIAMDFWRAYRKAAREWLPQADVVHDRFHIIGQLNKAIDKTRRQEVYHIDKEQRKYLKHTRYLFLQNPQSWTDRYKRRFQQIQRINLKTAQAWRMREDFKGFFSCQTLNEARFYLTQWFDQVDQTDLPFVKSVARTFQNHLSGILNFVVHRITNALTETINGLIKEILYVARGFRLFENFRIAVLFFLGKLDLYP